MTTEKQYPQSSTYAISDFFTAKDELKAVKDEMYKIQFACEITVMCKGDLTGRAYGMSYVGLEDATKLLVEFEQKAAQFEKAREALRKSVPTADYESLNYSTSNNVDYDRKSLNHSYGEIKKFFDLTHGNYEHSPAPKPNKVSGWYSLLHLAAYASLAYTVWHLIFR